MRVNTSSSYQCVCLSWNFAEWSLCIITHTDVYMARRYNSFKNVQACKFGEEHALRAPYNGPLQLFSWSTISKEDYKGMAVS